MFLLPSNLLKMMRTLAFTLNFGYKSIFTNLKLIGLELIQIPLKKIDLEILVLVFHCVACNCFARYCLNSIIHTVALNHLSPLFLLIIFHTVALFYLSTVLPTCSPNWCSSIQSMEVTCQCISQLQFTFCFWSV